jgi:hypothetical protein
MKADEAEVGGEAEPEEAEAAEEAGWLPTRLPAKPIEVEAQAIRPDGPVMRVRRGGELLEVAESIGPQRVWREWWREPSGSRDYYRLTLRDGRRWWLSRDEGDGRWRLEGEWL